MRAMAEEGMSSSLTCMSQIQNVVDEILLLFSKGIGMWI